MISMTTQKSDIVFLRIRTHLQEVATTQVSSRFAYTAIEHVPRRGAGMAAPTQKIFLADMNHIHYKTTTTTTTFDLDRTMSLPETTIAVNNPEMDECDPWQLDGTRISPNMKRRMMERFGEWGLPALTNTQVTDRGAQVILDLDKDVWYERRAFVDWFNLKIKDTNIGDVGIEALALAFVQTTTPNAVLWLDGVKALDDETAVRLATALNTNQFWETLWIEDCNFGSRGLKALVGALRNNNVWQELKLFGTNLEDEGVEALAKALQQNTQWTNFELWYIQFSSVNGIKALVEALSVNKTWKSFQLEVRFGTRVSRIRDCELEALSCALRRNQCWETFHYICPSDFNGGLGSVTRTLHGNSVWRVFDMDLEKATHVDILAEALRRQTSWKYFALSLPYDTPDQGVEMLANLLKTSPSWERFVLHVGLDQVGPWLKVGPAILQRLDKHWNSLVLWFPYSYDNPIQHLPFLLENHPDEIGVTADTISNLFLTRHDKATDALEMAEYLGHCWQSMDLCMLPRNRALRVGRPFTIPRTISLHGTSITIEGARRLTQSIQGGCATPQNRTGTMTSTLTTFTHRGNAQWVRLSLSDLKHLGNEGANAIADMFLKNTNWLILDLADSDLDDLSVQALVNGMGINPDWRCMNLSHIKISQQEAHDLGMALSRSTAWSNFSVSNMPMVTGEGVVDLVWGIARQSWHTLDLGFTNMSDLGLSALSQALRTSKTWRHLRLAHADVGDDGVISLSTALQQNSGWRLFDVGNTNMSDHDMKQVSKALKKNVNWLTYDVSHSNQPHLEAQAVAGITHTSPTWESIQYRSPNRPLLLASGRSEVSNNQEASTVIKSNCQLPSATMNSSGQGEIVAQIGNKLQCLDTILRHAIEYGATLIVELDSMSSMSFVKLGKRLLKVSDALGRINTLRLQMTSGKEDLEQLNPQRLKTVQDIMSFGIDLAKMMLDKVPSANQKPKYHVFISFAGEVRKELEFDYVTSLEDQLQIAAGGGNILNIFVAEKTMHAGHQSYPLVTMLTNALTARVVVCVTSTHYVQKKWCIAELLCALARNETVCPWTGVSRVIVDAFPGCHWVLPSSPATASASLLVSPKNPIDRPISRSANKWLDDFSGLFPTQLPTMQICEITGENVYGKCCSANFGRNNSCVTS